jgi:RND family efflux transporter MFP subunit
MNLRYVSFWSLVLICVLSLMPGCMQQTNEEAAEPSAADVQVEVARVEQGPVRQIVLATGILGALPNRDVKVSALVSGRVSQLLAIEGDKVLEGQVIAKLDSSTYEDQLKQAKATLENARQNEARLENLYGRGIAAGRELEDAHKDGVIAQSVFDTAAVQLSRTQVRSPISGVVVKRFINVGEQVDGTSNQPIEEIADFDPIELAASVQTTFLPYVKTGQDVEVRIDANKETIYHGTVVSVLPAVDAATNSATVRIRMPNSMHELRGGMFATAAIIAAVRNDAIYIPIAAVSISNNEPKVFVVGSDSLVQERPVKTNWRDGDKIEILDGVKKGEVVVTTGSYGLGDKMKVTVLKH